MRVETNLLKILDLVNSFNKSLLFFLFLLSFCGSPPSPKYAPPEREGILFPIHPVHGKSNFFKRFVDLFIQNINQEHHPNVSLNTFYVIAQISPKQNPSHPKDISRTRLLVDTGSDENLHKKIYFKNKGSLLTTPIHTANDKVNTEFEIHKRYFSPPDKWENLGMQRFLVSSSLDPLPFDGILGNRFFSKYVVWMDFEKELRIFPHHEWTKLDIKGMEEFFASPEIFTHWLFPVTIQGKTYNFIFDTGADYTVLQLELAEEFPKYPNLELKYMEFSGKIYDSKVYKIPEICLGKTICSQKVTALSSTSLNSFLKNSSLKVDGILGMNWIKEFNVYLHYPQRKLYIQRK